jgi:hypothetical protein
MPLPLTGWMITAQTVKMFVFCLCMCVCFCIIYGVCNSMLYLVCFYPFLVLVVVMCLVLAFLLYSLYSVFCCGPIVVFVASIVLLIFYFIYVSSSSVEKDCLTNRQKSCLIFSRPATNMRGTPN